MNSLEMRDLVKEPGFNLHHSKMKAWRKWGYW